METKELNPGPLGEEEMERLRDLRRKQITEPALTEEQRQDLLGLAAREKIGGKLTSEEEAELQELYRLQTTIPAEEWDAKHRVRFIALSAKKSAAGN